MNVEVHCANCRTAYVVDDGFDGTTLPCPACAAPEGLVVPALAVAPVAAQPTPKTEPAAVAAPAPATLPRSASVVQTQAPPSARPSSESEEMVCPRCNLHFVPRKSTAEKADRARRSVLVVEAMDYFREIATEALSEHFEVKEASSVVEACALLEAGSVDLIILDPENGGIDLLRALGRKPCPILVFTDRDESDIYGDSWEELQRYGADDIVMKGMNAGETLARKVGGLLGVALDEDE